jgi:excisionase family DNA binding protein
MWDVKRDATTKQVAATLGVTESTVQLYSRTRRIPFDRTPGGHRRYNVDEVRAALDGEGRTALAPLARTGLGAGRPVRRGAMASMDAERRAVAGEARAGAERKPKKRESTGAASATVELIGHSRRVLVAV